LPPVHFRTLRPPPFLSGPPIFGFATLFFFQGGGCPPAFLSFFQLTTLPVWAGCCRSPLFLNHKRVHPFPQIEANHVLPFPFHAKRGPLLTFRPQTPAFFFPPPPPLFWLRSKPTFLPAGLLRPTSYPLTPATSFQNTRTPPCVPPVPPPLCNNAACPRFRPGYFLQPKNSCARSPPPFPKRFKLFRFYPLKLSLLFCMTE